MYIITIFKASPTLNVCSEIRSWGELVFNICISIFAAFIFYIFQVYIPGQYELKNAEKALKNDFFFLAQMIDLISMGIEEFVEITDGKVNIKWNDPHGGINNIIEDSRKISLKVQKKFNVEYCYHRKELDAREIAISVNAQNPQIITNINALNDEIAIEYGWQQAINNPDIMSAVNGDKSQFNDVLNI